MRNAVVSAEQLRLAGPGLPDSTADGGEERSVGTPRDATAHVATSRPGGGYRDRVRTIALGSIATSSQPLRDAIDPAALARLAADLGAHGLLQLPGVRACGPGRYEVVWGNRRVLAARAAGWQEIQVVLVAAGDLEALLLAARENLLAVPLTDAERARFCADLLGLGLSPAEIHDRVGIDPADVSRLTRAAAHPQLGPALARGDITWGEARELVGVPEGPLAGLIETLAARRRAGSPLSLTRELRPLVRQSRPPRPSRRGHAPCAGEVGAGTKKPADHSEVASPPGQYSSLADDPGRSGLMYAIRDARARLAATLREGDAPPWEADAVADLEALAALIAAVLRRHRG